MHPYLVEQMVQERRQELLRLSEADRRVRAARQVRTPLRTWRRGAGRALVGLAVAVGVPRARRANARRQVASVLGLERPG